MIRNFCIDIFIIFIYLYIFSIFRKSWLYSRKCFTYKILKCFDFFFFFFFFWKNVRKFFLNLLNFLFFHHSCFSYIFHKDQISIASLLPSKQYEARNTFQYFSMKNENKFQWQDVLVSLLQFSNCLPWFKKILSWINRNSYCADQYNLINLRNANTETG